MVFVIDGRSKQGVTDAHAPMLPARIDAVVVVVVTPVHLVGDGFSLVVIDGTRLVFGAYVLNDDRTDKWVGGQGGVNAQQVVLDAILQGEHGLILKIALKIGTDLPGFAAAGTSVPCQAHVVASQRVAEAVAFCEIDDIAALACDGSEEGAAILCHLDVCKLLTGTSQYIVCLAAKLRKHLDADFESQGNLGGRLFSEFPIEGFFMVQDVGGVFTVRLHKILLPACICGDAEGCSHLPFPPSFGVGKAEIINVQTGLWDGVCIDTITQTTAGQFVVS